MAGSKVLEQIWLQRVAAFDFMLKEADSQSRDGNGQDGAEAFLQTDGKNAGQHNGEIEGEINRSRIPPVSLLHK